jgi:RHS repeat-associated protein
MILACRSILNGQTVAKNFVPLAGGATAVFTSSGLTDVRHADWLGNSRFASTPSRTMYFDTAYAPFGEPYAQSGTTDLSFTGQNSDTTSGVYDFLYRPYSIQGRWPTPDPAGLAAVDPSNPQTWNRYAYVRNNPLNRIDPTGTNDCEEHADCENIGLGLGSIGQPGQDIMGAGAFGDDVPGCGWADFWGGDCAAVWHMLDPSGRGQSQLLADEARYASIISTGWDPELQRQYYSYSFAGGCNGALQCQTQLAAIQFGQQACAGQGTSAVASCIEQVYSQLLLQALDPNFPLPAGGNYNFSFASIQINGQNVNPNEFGCIFSRCGILDSLDFSHGGGTFHVDTANVWFFPLGTILHTVVDLLGGHTWWRGGIPRFP